MRVVAFAEMCSVFISYLQCSSGSILKRWVEASAFVSGYAMRSLPAASDASNPHASSGDSARAWCSMAALISVGTITRRRYRTAISRLDDGAVTTVSAFCAAVPGATFQSTSARLSATGSDPTSATSMSDSAL